jgi:hypothetical protein
MSSFDAVVGHFWSATRKITLKKFLTGLFSRQPRSMSKSAVRFKHSASHRGFKFAHPAV